MGYMVTWLHGYIVREIAWFLKADRGCPQPQRQESSYYVGPNPARFNFGGAAAGDSRGPATHIKMSLLSASQGLKSRNDGATLRIIALRKAQAATTGYERN